MSDDSKKSYKRVLEPPERISEVLFGLIMVLSFTCSFSVAGASHGEVRRMLLGALGCNVAWGIIDGVFYIIACLSEKGHGLTAVRAVRQAADPEKARRIIAEALPPVLVSLLPAPQLEVLRQGLLQLPEPPPYARLSRDDWRGAAGVMLLVFLSTFPPTIPFIFMRNLRLALRISNLVAIAMLFMCGYAFGHHSGFRPWRAGLVMVVIGVAMVGLTIALGG